MCDIAVADAAGWSEPTSSKPARSKPARPRPERGRWVTLASTEGTLRKPDRPVPEGGRFARLDEFVASLAAMDRERDERVAALRAALEDGSYDLEGAFEQGVVRALGEACGETLDTALNEPSGSE